MLSSQLRAIQTSLDFSVINLLTIILFVSCTNHQPQDVVQLTQMPVTITQTYDVGTDNGNQQSTELAPTDTVATRADTNDENLQPTEPLPTDAMIAHADMQYLDHCIEKNQDETLMFEWQMINDKVDWLSGVTCPIVTLRDSKDGRWTAISLLIDVYNQMPQTASILIDNQRENHMLLNTSLQNLGHVFQWSENNQLIWIYDESTIGLGNGSAFQLIPSPNELKSVWFAVSGIVLANSVDGALWSFNLENQQWQLLDTFPNQMVLGIGTAIDQNYSVILGDNGTVWTLSTDLLIHQVNSETPIPFVGSDGNPFVEPIQIHNTNIWFIDRSIWSTGVLGEYPIDGFLINVDNGELLTNSQFELSEDDRILGMRPSPTQQVIALFVREEGESSTKPSLYLFEPVNWTQLSNIKGAEPFDWQEGKSSLFITNEYVYYIDNADNLILHDIEQGSKVVLEPITSVWGSIDSQIVVTFQKSPHQVSLVSGASEIIPFPNPNLCDWDESYTSIESESLYLFAATRSVENPCPLMRIEPN